MFGMLDNTRLTKPYINTRLSTVSNAFSHLQLNVSNLSNISIPSSFQGSTKTLPPNHHCKRILIISTMKAMIPELSLKGLLALTKAQFQLKYPPTLRYDNITVGAIIFNRSPAHNHKLLLLKRAAHDPAFPEKFAIPGAHVEDTDESIEHGLKREVWEETSMTIEKITDQINPLAWVTQRSPDGDGAGPTREATSIQIMFVCDVDGETFKVDPEEHSMGVWADREEAASLDMSTGMRRVVSDAFSWKESMLKKGTKL